MAEPKPKQVAVGTSLFYARLDVAMRARGMNQADLAAAIGLSSNGPISGWRSGVTLPRLDNVEKLARALAVDFAWLAVGEGTNPFPVVPLKVPRKRRKK